MTVRSVLALPVFPGRCQPSIVGRSELNYRVRNGNGWTLALISTNFVEAKSACLRFRAQLKAVPKNCDRFLAPPLRVKTGFAAMEMHGVGTRQTCRKPLYVIRLTGEQATL